MNVASLILERSGFVISDSVRKVCKDLRSYVLEGNGYEKEYVEDGNISFMYKQRLEPYPIIVKDLDGRKRIVTVNLR